jgi:hypothetical protein
VGPSFAPLRVGGFRRLLLSYVVNELGDSFALVALAVLVFDRTGDALATTALFVAAKFVPALLAPALVARVDQHRLARSLPAIYGIEAVLFVALAVIAATAYSLPAVLALALVDGTLALAARGLARGGVAAVLAPSALLREGNALMNVGFGVALIVGTASAGLIVSAAGVATGLYVDAASFAIVAVVTAGLGGVRQEPSEQGGALARLREGIRHVGGHPLLRALIAGQALALVFFTLILPIEVIYAKKTLDAGDVGFGLLLAAWNGGILVGSLAFVRLGRRSPAALVLGSTLAIGAAYAGLAVAGELWLACLLSVVGGVGNGFQWVSVMTLLQEATPLKLQARVVSLLESVGAAMPGVGFVLGGLLTAAWSPRTAYAVAGLGLLAIVGIALLALPRRATRVADEPA